MKDEHPLKLLIVEDETSIRNLLKMIVDWESVGVRVIGEAATGAEALYLMEEELPDIVLTDIEMPYMDGLELSRRILERYSDVTVIILTAHDHFEYARDALRMGVAGYLLKPIDKEKLEAAVSEAVGKIRGRRALIRGMEASYKYVKNNKGFFRDYMLRELVHNGPAEDIEDMLDLAGMGFTAESRYTLALLKVAGDAPGKYLLLNNCKTYVDSNYASGGRLYAFVDGFDNLALLCCDDNTDLPDVCRRITEVLSEGLKSRIYCGVSDPCGELGRLPRIYAQARDALRLSLIAGSDALSSPESAPPGDRARDTDERMRDVLLFIKSGLTERAVAEAKALLEQINPYDLNGAKLLAFRVLSGAVEVLTKQDVSWLALIPQIAPYYSELFGKEALSEVLELLSEQVRSLCEIARSSGKRISNERIAAVIGDIGENYADQEISLTSMARKFAVNSSYLSRAFKSYTGKSFSDYLIETRIQAARSILEHGDMKAYQVARMVGIPDPNYFTKCFKKVTGMSFQAYKTSL